MVCAFEKVGVGAEGDGRVRVSELAGDIDNVEALGEAERFADAEAGARRTPKRQTCPR